MTTPKCVVFIPDGNRRWAEEHHYPQLVGHAHGLSNCRRIARSAFMRGIEHVVFWAASTSNCRKRNSEEIAHIFLLLKQELVHRAKRKQQVSFHLCGSWEKFCTDREIPELAEKVRRRNDSTLRKHLTVLFGYDGKAELVQAAQKVASSGEIITEDSIRSHLWTAHLPAVDLLIRTGVDGDPHWSDLLLPWQIKNTQLYFSNVRWPAFSINDLEAALEDYARRPRRRGA